MLEVFGVLLWIVLLRFRVRLVPSWFAFILVSGLALPTVGVWLSGAHPRWLRIERVTVPVFAVAIEAMTLLTLGYLIYDILMGQGSLSGHQLLATAVGAWVVNVMVFSLLYWQIDRGGPESRVNNSKIRPDWLFPQAEAVEETQPDWHPTYIDYLFLAFSTATAFSAADIVPLTARAKLLMMFESAVSLVTLVVVASRAINVLG
jgi:hypothetical protein